MRQAAAGGGRGTGTTGTAQDWSQESSTDCTMHPFVRDLTNALAARRRDQQAFLACTLAPLADARSPELLDSLWAIFESGTWEGAGRALGVDRRTARARYRRACRILRIREPDGVTQLHVMLAVAMQRLAAAHPGAGR